MATAPKENSEQNNSGNIELREVDTHAEAREKLRQLRGQIENARKQGQQEKEQTARKELDDLQQHLTNVIETTDTPEEPGMKNVLQESEEFEEQLDQKAPQSPIDQLKKAVSSITGGSTEGAKTSGGKFGEWIKWAKDQFSQLKRSAGKSIAGFCAMLGFPTLAKWFSPSEEEEKFQKTLDRIANNLPPGSTLEKGDLSQTNMQCLAQIERAHQEVASLPQYKTLESFVAAAVNGKPGKYTLEAIAKAADAFVQKPETKAAIAEAKKNKPAESNPSPEAVFAEALSKLPQNQNLLTAATPHVLGDLSIGNNRIALKNRDWVCTLQKPATGTLTITEVQRSASGLSLRANFMNQSYGPYELPEQKLRETMQALAGSGKTLLDFPPALIEVQLKAA